MYFENRFILFEAIKLGTIFTSVVISFLYSKWKKTTNLYKQKLLRKNYHRLI